MVNGMSRRLDQIDLETQTMANIFFEQGEAPTEYGDMSGGRNYWKDQVSKDLRMSWHKVGVEQFVEWEKRGFRKARRGSLRG